MRKTRWLLGAGVMLMSGCVLPPAVVIRPSTNTAEIAGTWTGRYNGDDSGTITIAIGTQGNVTCSLNSTESDRSVSLVGQVTFDRDFGNRATEVQALRAANAQRGVTMSDAAINALFDKDMDFEVFCSNDDPDPDVTFSLQGGYTGGMYRHPFPPRPLPSKDPRDVITGTWRYEQTGHHPKSYDLEKGQFSASLSKRG